MASSTGTGAGVFQTSPTITTPTIDTITSAASTALNLKSAGTTAIYADTSQNVGIGNTSPSASGAKLAVTPANTTGSSSYLTFDCTNFIDSNFQVSVTGSASTDKRAVVGTTTTTALALQTNGTERMRITSAGSVGIGLTAPSQTLDVSGSAQLTYNGGNNYLYFQSTNNYIGRSGSTGDIWLNTVGGQHTIFGISGTEKMRLNASGQLVMATSTYGVVGQIQAGITADTSGMNSLVSVAGDQNGGYPFGARGNSTTQGLFGFFNSSNSTIGSITKSGSNVAYNTSSDYRLKENIAPMTGALAKVAQLKPVTYKWKEDGKDGQGFIAHELAEVVPDCVNGEKDAVDADNNPVHQGVDTSFLVATLTAAIQELSAKNDALTARIVALENR
jgi:hypothetical protein